MRVGDRVERINCINGKVRVGDKGTIAKIRDDNMVEVQTLDGFTLAHDIRNLKIIEGEKMELNQVDKENLKEAKKKFDEEKTNNEIEFAKTELRRATDVINDFDRQIKDLQEKKKPYLEILDKFK